MTWLDHYLKRLSLTSWPALDLAGLALLQRRHIECIAFGNPDLLLGKVPELSHKALVEKLLVQERPGYCYELNLLFASLLTHLGLKIELHLARVLQNNGVIEERPRSHLVISTQIAGQTCLLDAGFGGGGLCEPIVLQEGMVFDQTIDRYRLLPEQGGFYLQREIKGQWSHLYWFDLTPANLADCQVSNHYAATASGSIFLRDLMVTRINGAQRFTLHNREFITRSKTGKTLEEIRNAADLQSIFVDYFGFSVAPDQAELLFKQGELKA